MNIRDIIEGYQAIKSLKRQGYVIDDNIGLGAFIKMVIQAERNVRAREEESNEEK